MFYNSVSKICVPSYWAVNLLVIYYFFVLECPAGGFKCDDGRCVPEHAFCNAVRDCSDGSDEKEVVCKRGRPKAHHHPPPQLELGPASALALALEPEPELELELELEPELKLDGSGFCPVRCANGRCRSAAILCTDSDGCGDRSDETHCQICRKSIVQQLCHYSRIRLHHPRDRSSGLPVISASLRGARGNICALRASQIALIAGVAA